MSRVQGRRERCWVCDSSVVSVKSGKMDNVGGDTALDRADTDTDTVKMHN